MKIKVSVVCQAPAAGGLKMVDVKSLLSAFKIGWLKRILCDKREDFAENVCALKTFKNVTMQKVYVGERCGE